MIKKTIVNSKQRLTLSDLPESEKAKITVLIDRLVSLGKEHEELTTIHELDKQQYILDKQRYNDQINSLIKTIDDLRMNRDDSMNNNQKKYQLTLSFLSIYQNKIESLIKQNESLDQVNKDLTIQLNKQSNEFNEQRTINRNLIDDLNNQIINLNNNLIDKNKIINEFTTNQSNYINEINRLENLINDLSNKLSDKSKVIDRLQINLSNKSNEITKLTDSESANLSIYKSEVKLLKDHINSLNQLVIEKDNEISSLQTTLSNNIISNDSINDLVVNQSIDLSTIKSVDIKKDSSTSTYLPVSLSSIPTQSQIPDVSAMFSSITLDKDKDREVNRDNDVEKSNIIRKLKSDETKKMKRSIRLDKSIDKPIDKQVDKPIDKQIINYNNKSRINKRSGLNYDSSFFNLLDEIEANDN